MGDGARSRAIAAVSTVSCLGNQIERAGADQKWSSPHATHNFFTGTNCMTHGRRLMESQIEFGVLTLQPEIRTCSPITSLQVIVLIIQINRSCPCEKMTSHLEILVLLWLLVLFYFLTGGAVLIC